MSKPLKTIMAAANKAMPGDVITVHAGVYREEIVPPRGGNSENERIVYQAAKGEKVTIKGSEIVKGWKKQENDTWVVKIPNSFFGKFNPYKEQIKGDWFWPDPKDRIYLRGAVYLNGDWLMEAEKKELAKNHINRSNIGIWLDWMAQGAQIKNNLMHDNLTDIFLEVNHGPMLVSNNVLLSKVNISMNSSGAALVHNIFGGEISSINYDGRLTPFHLPHSTYIAALHDNPGGDVQFVNNLFVNGGNASQYSKALLPVSFDGNVYTKGAVRAIGNDKPMRFGEMGKEAQEQLKKYKEQNAEERNAVVKENFDVMTRLLTQKDGVYLEINLDKRWLTEKQRKLVTTQSLLPAAIPNLPYENTDRSALKIDTDYFGNIRNTANPSPGAFEILKSGKQLIKVWSVK